MKAVVQRVKSARLSCDGKLISEIEKGLVVYFGVAVGDETEKADYLAKKIAALRVFEDQNGKMNLSVKNVGGEILSVSQFTLLADVSHGNRPGFSGAEVPLKAEPMYNYFCEKLSGEGVTVKVGVFGGDMTIEQVNDGPVTIIYEI
ncbi:MAG: D-aminoacyl-tRNA deacylase [Candidatus Borkfalkiaceae bacterium]|nr:D-aminoacyl-tRNA deacylase [Christensenellaceae bacterium]